jgi:succinyl-diaminopimelate desuccinylase
MYKEQIEAYFADKEQTLIDAVCRLVAIDSVEGTPEPGAPFGPGPAAALDEALKLAQEWGLTATNHEGYVGTADLCDKEDGLHILGHLDVVTPGDGWKMTEPYTPKLVDGVLFGRGTDDDKGPVAASLLAMKAVKDLGIPLKKNCRLIMGTNEESGSGDIAWYFGRHPYAPATFSPDSGFPVVNTEKGGFKPTFSKSWTVQEELPRLRWLHGGIRINVLPGDASAAVEGIAPADMVSCARDITAHTGIHFSYALEDGLTIIRAKGTGSHAAWPEGGNNAITGLLALLCALPLADGPCTQALHQLSALLPHGDYLGKALGIAQSEPIAGPLTVSFTLLEVTDTGLEGRFDARVPLCATEENCLNVAKKAFEDRGFSFQGEQNKPHHTPADSPFVQTLLRRYEDYTGQKGECLATGGGTYVHDIPGGVAFGCTMPGFDSHLHGADERVRVADLMVSAKMFAHIIIDICS